MIRLIPYYPIEKEAIHLALKDYEEKKKKLKIT
jgi:hypothetical protein